MNACTVALALVASGVRPRVIHATELVVGTRQHGK